MTRDAKLVVNLVAQMAFGLFAMTICLPSMQEWDVLLGATPGQVQLTFSGFVAAYGVLQVLYGSLSDHHGRRQVLLVGLAVAAAASLAGAFATDIRTLILARILQGAGCAAGIVIARAAVQDLFEGTQRMRVMAYVGMAMGVCPPLATVLGGQLHARLGWRANFLLLAALAVVLMMAAWRGLPGRAQRPPVAGHWLRAMGQAWARLVREPAFLLYAGILALASGTFYVFLGGAPLVLGSYGVGPAGIGWYIMIVPLAYIAGSFLATRLAHRKGERRMMRLGQATTLAGIALSIVLGLAGHGGPLAFSLPMALVGVGHGLLMPACLAATVGLIPALAGAAAGLAGVLQQLTGSFGGYAVGWMRHDGQVHLGWLMLAFALGCALVQAVLHARTAPASGPARAG